MAKIRCKHGIEHMHSTVEESRRCWQGPPVQAAPPSAASPPLPIPQHHSWRLLPVTDRQIKKIDELNGDTVYAHKLLRGEASDYIERLIANPAPVAPPQPPPPPPTEHKRLFVSEDPRLKIIDMMIGLIPEGYYATAPQGEDRHNDFVRIVTQQGKRSHFHGALTVQTQHSDAWSEPKLAKWPSGKWSVYQQSVIPMVQEIVADYKTAALRYSVYNTRCMRCGKKLTDDRSKHYLVGPECEVKHNYVWPIKFADEQNGASFEQLRHVGKPYNQHHQMLGRRVA